MAIKIVLMTAMKLDAYAIRTVCLPALQLVVVLNCRGFVMVKMIALMDRKKGIVRQLFGRPLPQQRQCNSVTYGRSVWGLNA